jgi:hypothetical protein
MVMLRGSCSEKVTFWCQHYRTFFCLCLALAQKILLQANSHFYLATALLIHTSCFCLSFTFNQPFNQRGVLPTLCVYKLMFSLNKSVLYCTQVLHLLYYSG